LEVVLIVSVPARQQPDDVVAANGGLHRHVWGPPGQVEQWLGGASIVVRAVTAFLEDAAGLLRQLVHVVGWLVLLVGTAKLLIDPHVTPAHLVVPGAAALAVLQGLIRPWWRQGDKCTIPDESLPSGPPHPK
jgi:hypothetical protein